MCWNFDEQRCSSLTAAVTRCDEMPTSVTLQCHIAVVQPREDETTPATGEWI